MTLGRTILFKTDGGTGGVRLEICWIAVETSIRQGKYRDFKRELETTVLPKYGGSHIKATLEYIDLLDRRETGDVAGLFAAVLKKGVSNAWHQNRWRPEPFRVEALEIIATMGDPAFDWLVQKATGNAFPDQMLALTAIAHFRNERALAFIRGDQWKLRQEGAAFKEMLEKVHAGTPRKRLFAKPAREKQ
jgi:hypothetical protein